MREHRKGVAARVPLNAERTRYGNRGLGPRGGTSPLLSNRETRPGALEDENREWPALSFFPSPSLSLCFSIDSFTFLFLTTINRESIPVKSSFRRSSCIARSSVSPEVVSWYHDPLSLVRAPRQ